MAPVALLGLVLAATLWNAKPQPRKVVGKNDSKAA